MDREYISDSIAKLLLDDDISPLTSAIDVYNYWAQKCKIIITNPDVASWTLNQIKSLQATDKTLIKDFLN